MQHYSSIYIKVCAPEVWERFEGKDDAGLGLAYGYEHGDIKNLEIKLNDDCYNYTEDELEEIVRKLADVIGKGGIIVGCTSNINVDPYKYVVYDFGDGVDSTYFNSDISEPSVLRWVKRLYYSRRWVCCDIEKEQLERCGILYDGRTFKEIPVPYIDVEELYDNIDELQDYEDYFVSGGLTVTGDGICIIDGVFVCYDDDHITDLVIPEGVKKIDESVFSGNKYLSSVVLPGSMETIDENTFFGCENLKKVVISEGISKISSSAFENCVTLADITIPDSVTEVGSRAFYGCRPESVKLPDSVLTVGEYAVPEII